MRHVLKGDDLALPAHGRLPARHRERAPRAPPLLHLADKLPADGALRVGVDDVLRGERPLGERLAKLLEAPRPVRPQEAPHRLGLQPRRAQRDRLEVLVERRADNRPARCLEHLLLDRRLPAYFDELLPHAARHEAVALAHTAPVRADLLQVDLHVVHHPGGDAPRGDLAVADHNRRGADERRARCLPLRRADVRQIPGRRDHRGEVRVVGDEGSPGARARRGDGPVVGRATPVADDAGQQREIIREAGGWQARRRPDRRGDRLPVRVAVRGGLYSLRPVIAAHDQPGDLDRPGGERQREVLHQREHVCRLVARRLGAEQCVLVRGLLCTARCAHRDPLREGVENGAGVRVEAGKLPLGGAAEADAAREAVEVEARAAC